MGLNTYSIKSFLAQKDAFNALAVFDFEKRKAIDSILDIDILFAISSIENYSSRGMSVRVPLCATISSFLF
jgi:hypothetical protein